MSEPTTPPRWAVAPGWASESPILENMTRSIPIKDLEKLAFKWEGWAIERIREHKAAPTPFTQQLADVSAGLMDAASELRRLIREISTGEEPEL